ncbi:hypothetical protein RF11_06547 [Thelohanellus kitauei]|uniref:Uncharacterized protein n=1 Tax=Thelohanellus kitauei TaxID=669202 RepID=A0A0C2MIP0_THEKT|nr:hypothetical protein RF11_06547 [Thelohanellus kitauei]
MAVYNLIRYLTKFTEKDDVDFFLQNFPINLYKELGLVSDGAMNADNFLEKRDLCFNIFKFIFRKYNKNILNYPKAHNFVMMFLKFIKTEDPTCILDPKSIRKFDRLIISKIPCKVQMYFGYYVTKFTISIVGIDLI